MKNTDETGAAAIWLIGHLRASLQKVKAAEIVRVVSRKFRNYERQKAGAGGGGFGGGF
jgi:hypothetical protein